MTATIAVTLNREGEERTYEATWDGEKWTSEDELLTRLLNAVTGRNPSQWSKGYHPIAVRGVAIGIAEYLNKFMPAKFVRGDEIDYSQYPPGTVF